MTGLLQSHAALLQTQVTNLFAAPAPAAPVSATDQTATPGQDPAVSLNFKIKVDYDIYKGSH